MSEKAKKFFSFSVKDEVAEIDIFDKVIGWDVWSGQFKADFDDAVGKAERVIVNLNSPGGNVTEGLAIYSLLQTKKENITVRVYGLAGSIASIIALGGSKLEMMDGSALMIHDPFVSGYIQGGAEDLRQTADTLDKMKDQLIRVYQDKTGMDRETIVDLMANETWMFAQEAVEKGFADEVVNEMKAVALHEGVEFQNTEAYSQYKNTILASNKKFEGESATENIVDSLSEKTAKELIAALVSFSESVTNFSDTIQTVKVEASSAHSESPASPNDDSHGDVGKDIFDLALVAVTKLKKEKEG